jgi:hypothetical protein
MQSTSGASITINRPEYKALEQQFKSGPGAPAPGAPAPGTPATGGMPPAGG